jgi:hypothetical protein
LLLFFKKEVLFFFFCTMPTHPQEKAFEAYRFQGFRSFVSRPMSLFLPLATARKAATGDT